MSISVQTDSTSKIKWAITIVVTLIILMIPTNDVYTRQMSLFFASTVFALFMMAFEFFDPIVVSIIMPMSWVALGVTNAAGAMSGWTNTIMYMVVGAYFLANALGESGLLKRIALLIIAKTGGKWLGLLFGVFLAGVVVSILTFGLSYIILATLCIGIIKSLELKVPSKASAMICFACMLGCCSSRCFIYAPSTYAVVIAQGQLIDPAFNITAIQAFTHNFPMFIVSVITLLIVYKLWKTDASLQSADYFRNELATMGKMGKTEKKTAVFLVIFFAMLLTGPWTGVDANLLFALAPWMLLLPGINVASMESVRTLNWQNVFFIAGCMAIGTVAASLGIGGIIAQFATPFMVNAISFGFFSVVFAITFVLNFFMTPLAIWSLMTVPLCQIALDIGMNIRPVCYALVMCSEAIILPYEYVPYLIVYSFGMISMGDFVKLNVMRCVLYFIGFLALLLPYWMLIGIL